MNIQCRMLKGEKRETIHFVIPDVEAVSQSSFVIARRPLDDVAIPILSGLMRCPRRVSPYEIATPTESRLAMTDAARHALVYLLLELEFYENVSKSIFLC